MSAFKLANGLLVLGRSGDLVLITGLAAGCAKLGDAK
jgi:hypothetical protein